MPEQLIDDRVSVKQCKRAIEALHAYATKIERERAETELLPGKPQHIWLQIATKTMYPERKLKPFRVPIKYPLVDPRMSSVCLITKDPQREYKDLLEQNNVKFISRVVGVEKLKGKFKSFEARRMLLKENDLFLADKRVIPVLPRLLGSKWFEAKKQPIPVCLTTKNIKMELERAIESTYMHQNKGTCTSVKIGLLSQTPKQVQVNLKTALPAIVTLIKGGWDNIQSLQIKTSTSTSLPIWTCELGSDEGGRWSGLVAEGSDEGERWNGLVTEGSDDGESWNGLAAEDTEEEVISKNANEKDEDSGEDEETVEKNRVQDKGKVSGGTKRRSVVKKQQQPKKRSKTK